MLTHILNRLSHFRARKKLAACSGLLSASAEKRAREISPQISRRDAPGLHQKQGKKPQHFPALRAARNPAEMVQKCPKFSVATRRETHHQIFPPLLCVYGPLFSPCDLAHSGRCLYLSARCSRDIRPAPNFRSKTTKRSLPTKNALSAWLSLFVFDASHLEPRMRVCAERQPENCTASCKKNGCSSCSAAAR